MKYRLITSAYNEEKNIKKTLESVIAQTITPDEWVIISDGSSDKTDDIVKTYTQKYEFIKFFRKDRQAVHSYGAKARAINWGLKKFKSSNWDFFGILDADISFQKNYFEILGQRFNENPDWGLAGGQIVELFDQKEIPQKISVESSVAGAVQFYRRECWEQLKQFTPMPHGGEDALLEITSRKNGWLVKTQTDLKVRHYGYVGKGSGNIFKAKIRRGISYYHLGYHPLFELARCVSRITDNPKLIGSILEFYGYLIGIFSKEKRIISKETATFLRKEQMNKLFKFQVQTK